MEGTSTDCLRSAAPKWSLAGDDQLLDVLHHTHQRIISKCQDVNSKLEEMASALDDSCINIQNINNKFMALGNSQFIENRVYDDDDELTTAPPPAKEQPQQSPIDELSILKVSLSELERAHETAEIVDDSDSDSDTQISVVLKPKDVYSHRPLPYIIGSQQWKNKWHAGLIVEDSDSDSSTSKPGGDLEQYSDTESDAEAARPPAPREHTISESSSLSQPEPPPAPPRPADVAAELARRLAAPPPVIEREPEEYAPPAPSTRKIYRPERPATSNIFPDEPPPLDGDEPAQAQSDDDDIFAEINRNKPYTQRNTVQDNLAEDLFRFDKPHGGEQGDIFSDFAPEQVETKSSAKQKPTLFDDESEPELFAEQPPKKVVIPNNNNVENEEQTTAKKPVGGISLFGSNKGAESIGAAILKRNRQESSTSGDESGSDNTQTRNIEEKPKNVPKNIDNTSSIVESITVDETDRSLPDKGKDIFDDLFTKSKKVTEKKTVQKTVKEPVREPVKARDTKNVKDLFSDNIFDDIDDIFTSNVRMPTKDSNQKSIFDDDDDDLFSDITKPKATNQPTGSKDKKSIFDSDDELFSDIKTVKTDKSSMNNTESQNTKPDGKKEINTTSNEHKNQEVAAIVNNIVTPTATAKERNLFDDSPQNSKNAEKPPGKSKGKIIFDSDSDDDILADVKIRDSVNTNRNVPNSNDTNPVDREGFEPDGNPGLLASVNVKETSNVFRSPSIFNEKEYDELFINYNKFQSVGAEHKDMKRRENENISSIFKDTIIETDTAVIEKETDSFPDARNEEYNILPTDVNEPIQVEREKSFPIPSEEIAEGDDIFDNKLFINNDLFSSSKKITKDVSGPNITDEGLDPSQEESGSTIEEVNDSTIEEANAESVKTEPRLDDTKSLDDKRNITIETNEPKQQDAYQSIFNDILEPVDEKEVLTTEQKNTMLNSPGLFDDIVTEPPAFEKVTEPKKSKNVNALFDDDSDDESLFFKKDDVISDEKPEIFTSNANFDIFISEPPAIDVDFVTKPTKNVEVNFDDDVPQMEEKLPKPIQNLEFGDNDEHLFNSMPKLQESVPDNVRTETEVANVELDKSKIANISPEIKSESSIPKAGKHTKTDNSKVEEKIGKEIGDSDDDLFSFAKPNAPKSQLDERAEQNQNFKSYVGEKNKRTDESDDTYNSKESPKKQGEAKRIGKLNTNNLNINVSALIPGASPKKVSKEQKDEQSTSSQESQITPTMVKLFQNSDETDLFQPKPHGNTTENDEKDDHKVEIETKPSKSITFEEKPESGVLDNNASKQRARIQVKRRPSTRRARHEAARRSAIDLADDTDNSSSFDEPVKSRPVKSLKVGKEETDTQNVDIKHKKTVKDEEMDNTKEETPDITQITASETVTRPSIFDSDDFNISPSNSHKDNKGNLYEASPSEIKPETSQVNLNENKKRGSTTKVVYILNDEDIFNTETKQSESKSDNDLFGAKNVENKSNVDIFKSSEGVSTSVKPSKGTARETLEEFKKDKSESKTAAEMMKKDEMNITKDETITRNPKSALFDDSDEEVFNKRKDLVNKTFLFNSDSEEDLFSGKKMTEKHSKEEKNREVKRRKEVRVKPSLFSDDDDDDDLFGAKKEITEPKPPSSKPSTSKETTASISSKSVELVFDDPLSMLGDDD